MKKKTLEQRFYETIGIKQFKKFSVNFVNSLEKLLTKIMEKDTENESGANYFLPKNPTVDDVINFKKKLVLNATIHAIPIPINLSAIILQLASNDPSTSNIVFQGLCLALSSYCIMLQRYNNIRINQFIESNEQREQKKFTKEQSSIASDNQNTRDI